MKQNKIKLAFIGGGSNSFIGIAHRIAAYMGERYELVGGVFSSDYEGSKEFAANLDLDLSRVYPDLDAFVSGENRLPENERIEAVGILTPNFLHFEQASKLISAGFHVICEKPITITSGEALELESLIKEKEIVFALTHTYTGYPMVRQMKAMIAEGVIGKIQKVDAQYYQGWINPVIHEKDKRQGIWRLDPKVSGKSSCFGDIGVHAFNMIEYTTGFKVEKVLADTTTMYEDNPLDVDGTALIRTEDGVRGVIRASQIATGEENNLRIYVYGDKGALIWEQEDPNYLTFLQDDKPAQIFKPGHAYNSDFATDATKIAPGHPEGIFDAMGNIYTGAARAIRGTSKFEGAYPGIEDGVRGMKFIEAVLESSAKDQQWITL
ncbi:MAG: Gfo/Idh/MocA family oxidoreductase [Cyclobacteriaceae bacterium]